MVKITITQTVTRKKFVGGHWTTIGQEVVAGVAINKYGYAPQEEKLVDETRELLSQELESIHLPSVIKAINQL